jgi:hypothetical protein
MILKVDTPNKRWMSSNGFKLNDDLNITINTRQSNLIFFLQKQLLSLTKNLTGKRGFTALPLHNF